MNLFKRAIRPALLFLAWVVTRHLLPYGLVATGAKVSTVNQGAYANLGFELFYGSCDGCETDLVSRRRLSICRSFSCFKRVG